MPAFDLENNDDFDLTQFDEYKIEDMEIGAVIDLENGNARIMRYKDEYLLFLMHEGLIRKKQVTSKNFKTLKSLISYLKK